MLTHPATLIALAAALLCGGQGAAVAAPAGLSVGIDDYPGLGRHLSGAAADAADIAGALKTAGAKEAEVLTDAAASRAAVKAAWDRLTGSLARGDVAVLSFAGLGGKIGERSCYLLSGYRDGGGEMICRDDILAWFGAAEAKGLKPVFIGDASFAGGLPRPFSQGLVQLRQVEKPAPPPGDDDLPLSQPISGAGGENGLARGLAVYGAEPGGAVPELAMGGKLRGALSWCFARGIEGAADGNRDGQISDAELGRYLTLAVPALTEGQQTPAVLPRRSQEEPLFAVADGKAVAGAAAMIDTVRLRLMGGGRDLAGGFPDVDLVQDGRTADLVWDVASGRLDQPVGGTAAFDVQAPDLLPILNSWAALDWLKLRAALAPARISLVSGAGLYHEGSLVQIEALPEGYPQLTLFDLMADGSVVPLLPEKGAPPQDWSRQHLHQMFRAGGKPFGAMHRIAIFSRTPLTGLLPVLDEIESSGTTGALAAALKKALPPDADIRIGIFPIYTAPKD